MSGKAAWMVLIPNVPEHMIFMEEEMDFFCDWYFGFEDRPNEVEATFRWWLEALPLGHFFTLSGYREGHRVVRCLNGG